MAVRAARIEIYGFGRDNGYRDQWKAQAVDCQRMKNRLWQIWLCHHCNHGSAAKLRAHFDEYRKWKEAQQVANTECRRIKTLLWQTWSCRHSKHGSPAKLRAHFNEYRKWKEAQQVEKPKWPCKSLEEPLTKSARPESFYRMLSAEFPNVNARTRGLLTNAWQSLLNKRKSASGSLPGWVAILFGNESLPSFTRPQPIPFDRDNAKLYKRGDKYILELRIKRIEESGKSVVEKCELVLNKRKCVSVRSNVDKIIAGDYKWKGSNLSFSRGKWYAMICYEIPNRIRLELDTSKVIYIRPGKQAPWRVSIGRGGSWRHCGNGLHVEFARRTIQRERFSRSEHNRYGGSNRKGRGRRNAERIWTKLDRKSVV